MSGWTRYFLRPDVGRFPWAEASKEEWVQAERAAGFRNTMGRPEEPATGGFSGNGMQGTITYDGGKPRSYSLDEGRYIDDEVSPSLLELEVERLRKFAQWVVSLDDPDPQSQGFQDHQTTTMTSIIRQAREALGDQ